MSTHRDGNHRSPQWPGRGSVLPGRPPCDSNRCGVAASGGSKSKALSELADALALHEGDGEAIDDEDAFFRELGIDPEEVADERTPPWCE